VSAFHSIQVEDCLILLQHLLDDAGLTESTWQGSHAEGLVVPSKEGRPLKLIYCFVHFGKGIPEGVVDVLGQKLLVRLGLKSCENCLTVRGKDGPHLLGRGRVRRAAEVLSIGSATISALQPHPVGYYYHLRGDGLEVLVNCLQFREEVFEVLLMINYVMCCENIYFRIFAKIVWLITDTQSSTEFAIPKNCFWQQAVELRSDRKPPTIFAWVMVLLTFRIMRFLLPCPLC